MTGAITFNSFNLQTYDPTTGVGIISNVIDHTSAPDSIYELFNLADANMSVIPDINSPKKIIPVTGAIKGSSQNDLDSRIDTFKAYFNGKNKNLDIEYGGATRRYTATVPSGNIKIERKGKFLFATFSIAFICTNPFGMDTTATSIISQTNYTSSSYTATPTIGGTAPYQLPIFTITVDALTGTGDFVQISNDNNDQEILVYGLGITAGDIIVIDCAAREVTINGDIASYYGTFLELEPGANSLTYTDGFTTRTVDIVGEYYKRYK